ncbi:PseG/SpsG family protein [Elusimicrobiota bacterium]
MNKNNISGKVVVFTEGGTSIGLGHLTRCVAVSEAIKEEYPEKEIVFMVYGDSMARDFLEIHGVKINTVNWADELDEILRGLRDDTMAVIDSYLAPEAVYNSISQKCSGKVLMIDDFCRLKYPEGLVVNYAVFADNKYSFGEQSPRYLLGNDYVILRKEFWDVGDKLIRKDVEKILISFGGMDFSELLGRVNGYIREKFNIECTNIDTLKRKYTAKDMLSLMADTDICISGGGQTLLELARVGVPAIGVCLFDNQINNIEMMHHNGFLYNAGWYNSENLLEKISDAIGSLLPGPEREKLSKTGRDYIDGKGVKRIINSFMNL